MAEALTALQDLKECPVCKNEFTDPRALPCDHSLCQACIDHIKKGSLIRCPVCNAVNDVKKVRRDFRLMQFLDVIKVEKQAKGANTKDSELHCDVCSSKCATHWCKNCQQWMCNGCKQTHSKIASCKNHTIETLSVKASEIKSNYNKEAKVINEKIQNYTTAANKIEERIQSLEITQMEAVETSERLRNKCMMDIQDYFDSIDAKILGFIQDKLSYLEINRNKLLTELQGIKAKWKHLEAMIEENSIKLVVNGQAIIDQAKRIKKSYADVYVRADEVSVKVVKGSSWEPSTAADLCLNGGSGDPVIIYQQTRLSRLDSITGKRYKKDNMVKLSNPTWCMRLIGDKLWACETDMIEIFDKNLKLIKRLENKAWGYVNDIVAIPCNGLVVVSSKGLLQIDSSGKDINTIDSGYFYSGVLHMETFYTYEYNTSSIVTYAYRGLWKKLNTVRLSQTKAYVTLTVSLTDNTITACHSSDGKIQVLNRTGQVIRTWGEQGSGSVGKLNLPRLCHEDDEGALLVADQANDRLQVLDRQRTWSIVNMEPGVQCPIHAVYSDGVLFVVSLSERMLCAYSEK